MSKTMFFASYKDANGDEHANLYFDYPSFYADTFSPECEVIQLIEFKTHGRNYKARKASLEEIAVEFSHNAVCGLSYGSVIMKSKQAWMRTQVFHLRLAD